MALIDVVNLENKKVGQVELADSVFDVDVKQYLLHSSVRMQLLNRRGGNASVKGRSDVRGGGAKPWRQKGTGRARAGTSSSPVWVGGGVAFGPQPKTYNVSINKKVKKAALRSALSMKYKDKDLLIVDNLDLPAIKTKDFLDTLTILKAESPLIVSSSDNKNLDLSSRNIKGVKVLKSEGLNVYDILHHKTLILTKEAIGMVEEVVGR